MRSTLREPGVTTASTIEVFLRSQWTSKKTILADLDGCILSGTDVFPGVPELIETLSSKLWIVSNNSEDTAKTLAERLALQEIGIPAERILLAGEQTLHHLARERPGVRVALYVAEPLRRLARALGLEETRHRPDVAVLGRDPEISLADLGDLMALAHRGVPIWLTNPDTSHPASDGTPRPETGALWAAIAAAVPCRPQTMIGKPAPTLLLQALAAAGTSPDEAVFIGDNLATDGRAAAMAGVAFVQIAPPADGPRDATDIPRGTSRGARTC